MSLNTLANGAISNLPGTPTPSANDNILSGLTRYIPTESITLYVAAVSAVPTIKVNIPVFTVPFAYWCCLAFTPVLQLLMFLQKGAVAGQPVGNPSTWPIWRMVAGTVAFGVWALAVPGFFKGADGRDESGYMMLASIGALLISTVLNLLEPIFEKK